MKFWKIVSVATVLILPTSVSASIVHMETSLGIIEIELFNNEAPVTVANFMNYVQDGDYVNSFIHRSVPGFVIQGGGFKYESNTFSSVPVDVLIVNEFNLSNVRGTIAMATHCLGTPIVRPVSGFSILQITPQTLILKMVVLQCLEKFSGVVWILWMQLWRCQRTPFFTI